MVHLLTQTVSASRRSSLAMVSNCTSKKAENLHGQNAVYCWNFSLHSLQLIAATATTWPVPPHLARTWRVPGLTRMSVRRALARMLSAAASLEDHELDAEGLHSC